MTRFYAHVPDSVRDDVGVLQSALRANYIEIDDFVVFSVWTMVSQWQGTNWFSVACVETPQIVRTFKHYCSEQAPAPCFQPPPNFKRQLALSII